MTAVLDSVTDVVSCARWSLAGLIDADLSVMGDGEVIAALRELEAVRSTVAAVDCVLLAQVSQRQLAGLSGARGESGWLAAQLRIRHGEAAARWAAARDLGPRRAVTGEPLEPVFATVAGALRVGEITAVHARIVVRGVDALPDAVQAECGVQVERELVEHARVLGPRELERCVTRIHGHLDPDGRLRDVDYRLQRRTLDIRQRADGSATIRGEATAELAEHLLVHLDVHAVPGPAVDGAPDPGRRGSGVTTRCSPR